MIKRSTTLLLILATLAVGLLVGSTGFASFVQHTSSNDFCTSCHEMKSTVYEEYKQTAHYNNTSGVRALCSDCHMPHDWKDVVVRKIAAVKDVYHHFLGTIDTTEKFEARRLHMAQQVWDRMKANGSKECRNCHTFNAMVMASQKPRASAQHRDAVISGETCIDCHKGITHKRPKEVETLAPAAMDDFALQ